MPVFSPSVETLVTELSKMPGIGRKSAQRIAFYLLKISKEEALSLAEAITDVKEKVSFCSVCFNMAETDPCHICADAARDHTVVCVVEEPKDLLALERPGTFKGVYHVLGGRIAPLDGLDPEKLTIRALLERAKSGEVQEVILALSATAEGDGTALCVADRLKEAAVRVTRLARGLPTGASLDYANPGMLADALRGRQDVG